ncbi:hypothetical protein [Thermoanaerobacter uzonensis]|uniref:hypothetical protein n=1 Tax=Thermoanaerobacter uzonensis TaxID=447593 RepID=UPI003D769017
MDGVNFLMEKLNNFPVIKVSLLFIIVAFVVLSGNKNRRNSRKICVLYATLDVLIAQLVGKAQ